MYLKIRVGSVRFAGQSVQLGRLMAGNGTRRQRAASVRYRASVRARRGLARRFRHNARCQRPGVSKHVVIGTGKAEFRPKRNSRNFFPVFNRFFPNLDERSSKVMGRVDIVNFMCVKYFYSGV